ncbi:MAG: FdtA/QdtA family cupin domain-containing protein [Bacteroidaceae bacterium]|nr:FdtA/QdtA family cupin domain-containing protein [Bacteroidaceae bacterium]
MAKRENKKVRIITLGKIRDKRGNLSVIQPGKNLPFEIARTYWIYDVPGGEHRGGHAYHKSEELITALSGSFDVEVHDGEKECIYHMNRCDKSLYIPSGTWRRICNFATNSTALIIASTPYSPRDYVRDFHKYLELKRNNEI